MIMANQERGKIVGNGNFCYWSQASTSRLGRVVRLTQRLGDPRWYATRVSTARVTNLPTEDKGEDSDTPSLGTVQISSVSHLHTRDYVANAYLCRATRTTGSPARPPVWRLFTSLR
jgi:hypothetical protein